MNEIATMSINQECRLILSTFLFAAIFFIADQSRAQNPFLWTKESTLTPGTALNSIVPAYGGGFVVTGAFDLAWPYGQGDINITRYDDQGKVLWDTATGGIGFPDIDYYEDQGIQIIQTHDLGYAVAGYLNVSNGTFTFPPNSEGAILLKLDSGGHIVWRHAFDQPGVDDFFGVAESPDHGFIVCGITDSGNASGIGYGWVMKTDSNGVKVWSRYLQIEVFYSMAMAPDGTCIFGGSNPVAIAALSKDGDSLWTLNSALLHLSSIKKIVASPIGGFDVVGVETTQDTSLSDQLRLLHISEQGKIERAKSFGGPGNDFPEAIAIADDAGDLVVSANSVQPICYTTSQGFTYCTDTIYRSYILHIKSDYTLESVDSVDRFSFVTGIARAPHGNYYVCGDRNPYYENSRSTGTAWVGLYHPTSASMVASTPITSTIEFYPNPTTGFVRIQLNEPSSYPVGVEIFNAIGVKVKSFSINPGTSSIECDLSDLPNGIYAIRIRTDSGEQSRQICVVR